MKYTPISKLRNKYSTDYRTNQGGIKYSGKFPKNFVKMSTDTLTNIKLSQIKGSSDYAFRFIVRFKGESESSDYTSTVFLNDLKRSQKESNPYFTTSKVSIIELDIDKLQNHYKSFETVEEYAQVSVGNTLDNIDDILQHINWMVDGSKKELRPTDDFGKYSVNEIKFENINLKT